MKSTQNNGNMHYTALRKQCILQKMTPIQTEQIISVSEL